MAKETINIENKEYYDKIIKYLETLKKCLDEYVSQENTSKGLLYYLTKIKGEARDKLINSIRKMDQDISKETLDLKNDINNELTDFSEDTRMKAYNIFYKYYKSEIKTYNSNVENAEKTMNKARAKMETAKSKYEKTGKQEDYNKWISAQSVYDESVANYEAAVANLNNFKEDLVAYNFMQNSKYNQYKELINSETVENFSTKINNFITYDKIKTRYKNVAVEKNNKLYFGNLGKYILADDLKYFNSLKKTDNGIFVESDKLGDRFYISSERLKKESDGYYYNNKKISLETDKHGKTQINYNHKTYTIEDFSQMSLDNLDGLIYEEVMAIYIATVNTIDSLESEQTNESNEINSSIKRSVESYNNVIANLENILDVFKEDISSAEEKLDKIKEERKEIGDYKEVYKFLEELVNHEETLKGYKRLGSGYYEKSSEGQEEEAYKGCTTKNEQKELGLVIPYEKTEETGFHDKYFEIESIEGNGEFSQGKLLYSSNEEDYIYDNIKENSSYTVTDGDISFTVGYTISKESGSYVVSNKTITDNNNSKIEDWADLIKRLEA